MGNNQVTPELENDPEAAFQLGCRILDSARRTDHYPEDREHAERCFEIAARLGGPEFLWRTAETYARLGDALAAKWFQRAVATLDLPDGIVADPNTLPVITEGNYAVRQDWQVTVTTSSRDQAAAALNAARERLQYVTDDGRELTSEEFFAALERGVDFFSPGYVAVDEDSLRIRLDCKDSIMPHMARTAIHIIAQELHTAGVLQATLTRH